jgi:hypothetical protein
MFLRSISIVLASWVLYKFFTVSRREPGLPPGPPTVPIIGNAHLLPVVKGHFKYAFTVSVHTVNNQNFRITDFAKQYGDIYSVRLKSLPL